MELMEDLFAILFLILSICFLFSWIVPSKFSSLFGNKLSKRKLRWIFGSLTLVSFFGFGIASDGNSQVISENQKLAEVSRSNSENKIQTKEVESENIEMAQVDTQKEEVESENAEAAQMDTQVKEMQTEIVPQEQKESGDMQGNSVVKIPKYEILNEIKNKRYDGGVIYFVLIDSVNLTNDIFKNDVKLIIKDIVKERGDKISVSIFDSKNVLVSEYNNLYGTHVPLNESELKQRGFHMIADYSGNLDTIPAGSELSFFPGAFKDDAKVGRYVETIGFSLVN